MNKKIAIMQSYFFPYIGYFQLMNAVDEFVIYDNIKYIKKGWINRNRILVNGRDSYITIPIKRDSDYLDIKDRYLSENSIIKKKIINRIFDQYHKSIYFDEIFTIVKKCILFEEDNLFLFIFNSLKEIKKYLEIPTLFIVSSDINIDHSLKSEKKVIEICKARNAKIYINPIGGVNIYSQNNFKSEDIELHFLKSEEIKYSQFNHKFIPWLSIIDVMMFNSKEKIKEYLKLYTLL